MERQTKKREMYPTLLPKSAESSVHIQDLDTDCMYEIFDRLTLRDLCAMAESCQQFKNLAEDYFQYQYKSKETGLKVHNNRLMCDVKQERFLSTFRESFQTVTIYGLKYSVFAYAAKNIRHLKKMRFKNNIPTKMKISKEHGEILKKHLMTLKSIEFLGNVFTNEHGEHLLKYCSNIESLHIETNIFEYGRRGQPSCWLTWNYPELKSIYIYYGIDRDDLEFGVFFKCNPSVEHLTIGRNIEKTLSFIGENGIKLNKITLNLRKKDDIETIIESLNGLYERGNLKRIELYVYDHIFGVYGYGPALNLLLGLESIFMKSCKVEWMHTVPGIFEKLKHLHVETMKPEEADYLSSIAFNLEELRVKKSKTDIVTTLASRLPKLERIIVNEVIGHPEFDWLKLTELRKMLNNSNKLIVYVNEKAYIPIKLDQNENDGQCIAVKRIESLIPYHPFKKYH